MKRILLGLLLILAGTTPTWACTGSACEDISITFEQGCYYGHNSGSRTVKVTLGEGGIGSVSTSLSPGERHRFTFFGQCFSGIVGDTVAVYED